MEQIDEHRVGVQAVTLDPGFTTEASRRIFSHAARLRRMLEVEVCLASAQASVGLIPKRSAEAIATAVEGSEIDASSVFVEGWELGTPILPLVGRIRALVGAEHGQYVHFGATTQDIVDTATVLQIRDAARTLEHQWAGLGNTLASLADSHRATTMLGRSFLQAGGVITFGRKAAGWLSAVSGDLADLQTLRSDLPVQLGGPMGVLAEMGDDGLAVTEALAERLELAVPTLPWHTHRWPITAAAGVGATVATTARKIAVDTILLAQSGIEEVTVRGGASSAIPAKRNPIDAIRANAAGRLASTQAGGLLTLGPYEHERPGGAWHAEWALVPLLFHGALAAAEAITRSVDSMVVDEARMRANLASSDVDGGAVGLSGDFVERAIAAFREVARQGAKDD